MPDKWSYIIIYFNIILHYAHKYDNSINDFYWYVGFFYVK